MRGSAVPPPEAKVQLGLFTVAQAMAAGYSTYRVRRLVRDRRWIAVLGSVYVEAATQLSQASLARAGVLAAGTGSVVSHGTAARMWGLVPPADSDVHVTVGQHVHLQIAGLRTHRVPLSEEDLDVRDGILCTNVMRTLIDCMLWLPEEAGRALVLDALRRRYVSVGELRSSLLRTSQRHGLARAWRIMRDVGDQAHSEAEVRLHRILNRAGIRQWRANARIEDAFGIVGFADVLFDDVPLVIEVDGRAYHSDDDRFQRDRARQNRLVLRGYTVLRLTWDDIVHRPEEIVRQVRATIAALRRLRMDATEPAS